MLIYSIRIVLWKRSNTAAIAAFCSSAFAPFLRRRIVTEPHNLKCLKCADNVRSVSGARGQTDLMFSCSYAIGQRSRRQVCGYCSLWWDYLYLSVLKKQVSPGGSHLNLQRLDLGFPLSLSLSRFCNYSCSVIRGRAFRTMVTTVYFKRVWQSARLQFGGWGESTAFLFALLKDNLWS